MLFKIFFSFIIFVSFLVSSLHADILKPAYLEIIQKNENRYEVLLKVPVKNKNPPLLRVSVEGCNAEKNPFISFVNDAYLERYDMVCTPNLKGKNIEILGLKKKNIDLLLRLEFLDKSSQSFMLTPVNNSYDVKKDVSSLQVIQTYSWLGITHILMGYDHLLFVFLLLLIVKNIRRLLWTISAFTLAHSITMAGATLGLVHLAQAPVEAIIALSIIFLALELVHEKQGKVGLTAQYPWLIAFIFGLLHGFGFAGALAEIGVPQNAITLALIFFNIGVELGQLMFVLSVVLVALIFKQFIQSSKVKERLELVSIYAIGGLASFWMIERVLAF